MSLVVESPPNARPRRRVTVSRELLERAAQATGDVGRLTAMERIVDQELAAQRLTLPVAGRTQLAQALLQYRGELLTLEVPLQELPLAEAPDDLLQALRHQRTWLRYPSEPLEWLQRVQCAAASLRYTLHTWRPGQDFDPPLPGMTRTAERSALDTLRLATDRVDALPVGTLLLFHDLELSEPRVMRPLAEVRGAMLNLALALQRRDAVRIALLMSHDEVPDQLRDVFRVVRLPMPRRDTPILDQVGQDLTAEARRGDLQPIVGNESQVKQIMLTLNVIGGQPNNVLLVGEAGVGKTALAEEVARLIAVGDVPRQLRGRRVVKVRANDLTADTGLRGQLEARVRDLILEVRRNRDEIILFVDEAHALFAQGGREAPIVQALKEGWARGDLPTIAATTLAEVSVLEADPAVASRFRRVTVPRPNDGEVQQILEAYGPQLERRHGLTIAPDSYACARESAARYLAHEAPPRSALRLLALAASHAELLDRPRLEPDLVLQEVEGMTRIPVRQPDPAERQALMNLKPTLGRTLHGQDEAIAQLAALIQARRFAPPRRPKPLVILAFGPSGTGKTETGRLLQQHVCDPSLPPILFPMEQAVQEWDASRFLGASMGLVGYDRGSPLVEKIAGRPHSTVIFDEIEKAHPRVIQALLQLFETGEYEDPRGRRGDYRSAIIVCTSNILEDGEAVGARSAEVRRLVVQAFSTQRDLRREPVGAAFVGRVQVLLPFAPLDERACVAIAQDRVAQAQSELRDDYGVETTLASGCLERLVGDRLNRTQNARPIVDAVVELASAAQGTVLLRNVGSLRLMLDWRNDAPAVTVEGAN